MKKTQWNLLKKNPKKPLELISEISKAAKYKIDEQISILSLYTRSEKSDIGIFKYFYNMKTLLRDKSNKRCERKCNSWYTENYKAPFRESKT